MPQKCVSRLLLAGKQESLALLKRDAKGKYAVVFVRGYRPFAEWKFSEIGFLDFSHSKPVRGYGTRFMGRTKERTNKLNL